MIRLILASFFLILPLQVVSAAPALFRPAESGVTYRGVINQEPRYEYTGDGLGMALNLGLVSYTLDIHHHPDAQKVRDQHAWIASLGRNVEVSVQFVRFSRNLRDVWLQFQFRNPQFKLTSGSDRFKVLVRAKVASCNDLDLPTGFRSDVSLESVMESFDQFDFQEVLFCELKIDSITSDVRAKQQFRTHDNYGFPDRFVLNKGAKLQVHGDREAITVEFPTRNPAPFHHEGRKVGPEVTVVEYRMDGAERDEDLAEKATESARLLNDKLMDYGDLILSLYDTDKAHRVAATQGFFNQQTRQSMSRWIGDIKLGIPHLNLREILTMNFSVNQTYGFVRFFEGKTFDRAELDYQIETYK